MQEPAIIEAGAAPLVQTTVRRRHLEMYPLLKQEIDRLTAGYSSPCLGLFGAFAGAFVSLLITDLTASLVEPMSTRFVDATVITGCAALGFLLFAIRDWRAALRIVSQLNTEIVDVEVIQTAQAVANLPVMRDLGEHLKPPL